MANLKFLWDTMKECVGELNRVCVRDAVEAAADAASKISEKKLQAMIDKEESAMEGGSIPVVNENSEGGSFPLVNEGGSFTLVNENSEGGSFPLVNENLGRRGGSPSTKRDVKAEACLDYVEAKLAAEEDARKDVKSQFSTGDPVRLAGLKDLTLNGKPGIISCLNGATGRFGVRLLDSGRVLAIKPDNLCKYMVVEDEVCGEQLELSVFPPCGCHAAAQTEKSHIHDGLSAATPESMKSRK